MFFTNYNVFHLSIIDNVFHLLLSHPQTDKCNFNLELVFMCSKDLKFHLKFYIIYHIQLQIHIFVPERGTWCSRNYHLESSRCGILGTHMLVSTNPIITFCCTTGAICVSANTAGFSAENIY